MYKNILLPIDIAHTDKAAALINYAQSQVAENGKILLLNVIQELPAWAAASLPGNYMSDSVKYSLDILNKLASDAGDSISVEVKSGHASKTILQVAEDRNVDLIIVVSHKPDMQDYLLGSTAAKVVRHARCSVLVQR